MTHRLPKYDASYPPPPQTARAVALVRCLFADYSTVSPDRDAGRVGGVEGWAEIG